MHGCFTYADLHLNIHPQADVKEDPDVGQSLSYRGMRREGQVGMFASLSSLSRCAHAIPGPNVHFIYVPGGRGDDRIGWYVRRDEGHNIILMFCNCVMKQKGYTR